MWGSLSNLVPWFLKPGPHIYLRLSMKEALFAEASFFELTFVGFHFCTTQLVSRRRLPIKHKKSSYTGRKCVIFIISNIQSLIWTQTSLSSAADWTKNKEAGPEIAVVWMLTASCKVCVLFPCISVQFCAAIIGTGPVDVVIMSLVCTDLAQSSSLDRRMLML